MNNEMITTAIAAAAFRLKRKGITAGAKDATNLKDFGKLLHCGFFFKNKKSMLNQCKNSSPFEKDGRVYQWSSVEDCLALLRLVIYNITSNKAHNKQATLFKKSIFACPVVPLPSNPTIQQLNEILRQAPRYLVASPTIRAIIAGMKEFRNKVATTPTMQGALLVNQYTMEEWLKVTNWVKLSIIVEELETHEGLASLYEQVST